MELEFEYRHSKSTLHVCPHSPPPPTPPSGSSNAEQGQIISIKHCRKIFCIPRLVREIKPHLLGFQNQGMLFILRITLALYLWLTNHLALKICVTWGIYYTYKICTGWPDSVATWSDGKKSLPFLHREFEILSGILEFWTCPCNYGLSYLTFLTLMFFHGSLLGRSNSQCILDAGRDFLEWLKELVTFGAAHTFQVWF